MVVPIYKGSQKIMRDPNIDNEHQERHHMDPSLKLMEQTMTSRTRP